MSRCSGRKPDGSSCQRIVSASQTFCSAHDPARAEARKRAASKAGRTKPNRELAEIKDLLSKLVGGVLSYKLSRGNAAVVNQLLNTRLRCIEIERKVKEQEEVLERLEELERVQDERRSDRWGT